jgi:hypothetical protein
MAWVRSLPGEASRSRRRVLGAVTPPVALDGGADQIPRARLADPCGQYSEVGALYLGLPEHARKPATGYPAARGDQPIPGVAGPTSPRDFTFPLLAAGGKWLLVVVLIMTAGPSLVRGPRPEALYNQTGNGRVGGIV